MTTTPQQPTAAELIAFLRGAAPLDGVWFGEPHPKERGSFWWRKHLSVLVAAPQPAGDEALEVLRQLMDAASGLLNAASTWGRPPNRNAYTTSGLGSHFEALNAACDRARKLVKENT